MDILRGLGLKGRNGMIHKRVSNGIPVPDWKLIGDYWVQVDDNTDTYILKGYKSLPYLYAIISQITDKASDAPGQIMKIKDQRAAKAYRVATKNGVSGVQLKALKALAFEQVDSHPFLDVIAAPNPLDTEKTLKEAYFGYLLITGNAYWKYDVPGAGNQSTWPQAIWTVPSPCVQIVTSKDRTKPVSGYKVSYFADYVIPEEQVQHTKYFNPVTQMQGPEQMLYGMAPMKSLVPTMSIMHNATAAEGKLLSNMAPLGILSGGPNVGDLTEEQIIGIKDRWRDYHMGLYRDGGDIVVSPSEVKWTQIGVSPVDLKLIEADKNHLQKVCAVYKFPKVLIEGDASYANAETADKQLITKCVMPLLRRIDDDITKYIQRAYNDATIEYVSDLQYYPELQEDKEKQAEWLSKAYWLRINEKRKVMDYDEVPDGDKILVTSGLSTLEDVVAPAQDIDNDLLDQNGLNDYDGTN